MSSPLEILPRTQGANVARLTLHEASPPTLHQTQRPIRVRIRQINYQLFVLTAQSSSLTLTVTELTHGGDTEGTTRTEQTKVSRSAAGILPSQEALGEGGELAFPVLDEVTLGHEVVELLSLLRHHHPRILLHAEPQTYAAAAEGRREEKACQCRGINNLCTQLLD